MYDNMNSLVVVAQVETSCILLFKKTALGFATFSFDRTVKNESVETKVHNSLYLMVTYQNNNEGTDEGCIQEAGETLMLCTNYPQQAIYKALLIWVIMIC